MISKPGQNKRIWRHSGPVPQRFSIRYARYDEGGGAVNVPSDAQANYAGQDELPNKERIGFPLLVFDHIHNEAPTGGLRG